MTQSELADRIGTTQSVISRLESDDYEGHSLSMLYRIAAALDRRIVVSAMERGPMGLVVRERSAPYEVSPTGSEAPSTATTPAESGRDLIDLDRLADRIAERFRARGVTKADVREAIRWARREADGAAGSQLDKLRGVIEVGRGDVVDDIRRARARRGAERMVGA